MEEKLFVRRDDIQIGMQLGESVKDIRGRAMIENGVYQSCRESIFTGCEMIKTSKFRRKPSRLFASIENRIVLKFSFPWK